jgi:1-acyl-sn-glycerol-3-phosphate acyltransferase
MKVLAAPIYFLYKLWIGLVFWLSLMMLYPFFWLLLQRRTTFPVAFQLKRWWARILTTLMFCPVVKEYKGNIPNGPFVIASNHQSYLDTVFMYLVFSDYFVFIGKAELMKWPLFSIFFKKGQDIPIHRGSAVQAKNSMLRALRVIKRGESIAIFPEGTVPEEAPKMRPFKNGAFKLAIDAQVPIIPVTWHRNHKVMLDPAKFWQFSLPQVVKVVVHPAVNTTGLGEQDIVSLRNHVFNIIQAPLSHEDR